ncbi:hypothetical protein LTR16_002544 [Cryomyces antarcticus]|uniref:Sialidase n=1 Tax=Cryomyces antarcticus TaxID=329879 RepID=A0ABR0M7P1_9PEZI|nr:hypothetical protein LTR39_000737 [Cryomyces antarcticus]KAK5290548.1 hypothetical protein LTR16_002544 [Cryomyces antarcticus]
MTVSPASALSPGDPFISSNLNSPIASTSSLAGRPSMAHSRSISANSVRTHSRSGSASSVDENVLGRYGYPTYRRMPNYLTNAGTTPMSNAMSHLMPVSMPAAQAPWMSYPTTAAYGSPYPQTAPLAIQHVPAIEVQAPPYPLAAELQFENFPDQPPTTTLLDYLTAPNPSPSLVQRVSSSSRGQNSAYWWDVRNLRSWADFDVSTIATLPGLLRLLECPVAAPALPTPGRTNLNPESEAQLQDVCISHHAAKVNAALKVAQGATQHMAIRSIKSQQSGREQPEFVANYQCDYEKTIVGDGRGRVVGIVKSFDRWNSGMRAESISRQVKYLDGLAHLQRHMREHGCRYGFIITEIELVCVRYGGPPSPRNINGPNVPLFGFFELAAPIQMATQGRKRTADPDTSGIQMTACLALFYLHMLAKESPFPGQYGWQVDVGGAAALTRANCLERDEWIPTMLNQHEKRDAKRLRGFVWPEEPLSRKECNRTKRRSAKRG